MNDLELCRRIAEIEGFDISDEQDYKTYHLFPKLCHIRKKRNTDGVDWVDHVSYSPLTDKALLFDLMVKHNINFGPYQVRISKHDYITRYSAWDGNDNYENFQIKDSPGRAILECIVEANNG